MKVLITGSASGIGLASAKKFLDLGHEVYGVDLLPSKIENSHYHHFIADIKDKDSLPNLEDMEIIFLNAGSQNSSDDIANNLLGTINTVEKYVLTSKSLRSCLFSASSSARSGKEFPRYVASKAGIVGYMKHIATLLAPRQITVNSISFGGVLTDSNAPVINDKELWNKIMDVTPMKKWVDLDEAADWIYFLLINNKSMSGQDILIDNGENDLNSTFVWPK